LSTKNALIKQYRRLLILDGVTLTITDDAVSEIAKQAVKMKTGARALRSILESMMLDIMYKVPQNEKISDVIIDRDVVTKKTEPRFIVRKRPRRATTETTSRRSRRQG
jgi:ATP-dependent Clp protease ATP-binding subunit ClpX